MDYASLFLTRMHNVGYGLEVRSNDPLLTSMNRLVATMLARAPERQSDMNDTKRFCPPRLFEVQVVWAGSPIGSGTKICLPTRVKW
jgi:hypothetical protein